MMFEYILSESGQGTREIMAWEGGSPLFLPVPCGAMTVIGVSTLPLKEVPIEQDFR